MLARLQLIWCLTSLPLRINDSLIEMMHRDGAIG